MVVNTLCRTEVAFGGGRGAAVWQGGFRFALVLGGATWGFGPPRRANGCPEAEKPAAAGAGAGQEGGVRCYGLMR
jgi:hypothetical protein